MLQSSGPISILDIANEFHGSGSNPAPYSMSNYIFGSSRIASVFQNFTIPSGSDLSFNKYYGTVDPTSVTYISTVNSSGAGPTFNLAFPGTTQYSKVILAIVGTSGSTGRDISTVTLNGISCTQLVKHRTDQGAASQVAGIYITSSGLNTLPNSGTCTITYTGTLSRMWVHFYGVRTDDAPTQLAPGNLASPYPTASNTFSNTSGTPNTYPFTLNTSRAGSLIGVMYNSANKVMNVLATIDSNNVLDSQRCIAFSSPPTVIDRPGTRTYVANLASTTGDVRTVGCAVII